MSARLGNASGRSFPADLRPGEAKNALNDGGWKEKGMVAGWAH